MIKLAPLTADDLTQLGIVSPSTLNGMALRDDATTLAVAGLTVGENHILMVAHLSDDLRARMQRGRLVRELLAGAKSVLKLAGGTKLPIYSVADPAHHGSARLLEHLGFQHYREETYQWHG